MSDINFYVDIVILAKHLISEYDINRYMQPFRLKS